MTARSKTERFTEFTRRLSAAPPASTAEEALSLLADTLNAVEDEFSGVPYDPEKWQSDGRMYPPQADSERKVPGRPELRRYRSRSHNTIIGDDGSIEIKTLDGTTVVNKPGAHMLRR
jgi:hypothetical protein